MNNLFSNTRTVDFNESKTKMKIINQTKLPSLFEIKELSTPEEIWNSIYLLEVRGAPAIGVAAAIGIYLTVKDSNSVDYSSFREEFEEKKKYLASARPAAANLSWALERMYKVVLSSESLSVPDLKKALLKEAENIRNEDILSCRKIGEYGSTLIHDGDGILTHCNAGRLATVEWGTALSPIYIAKEKGKTVHVYTDETRPLLQGSRLSAYELYNSGIDTTVLCDNMASYAMKSGRIQLVLVGADRIACNGDFANKIGTSGVAILSKYYGIPFYCCAPLSTIDINTKSGDEITIEQRKGDEVTDMWYKTRMAPDGVNVLNPCFDVTPNDLVTGIITEYGIIYPPFKKSIEELFASVRK